MTFDSISEIIYTNPSGPLVVTVKNQYIADSRSQEMNMYMYMQDYH